MNAWFYIGYFVFTLMLGFLMGASNSPVIGSFLSGIIGLIVAWISVQSESKDGLFSFTSKSLSNFGKMLIGFSFFLLIGLFVGENYRNGTIIKPNKTFVWEHEKPPYNLYEALDWIALSEKLTGLGYSEEQINQLYILRLKDRVRLDSIQSNELEEYGYLDTEIYDKSNPYHAVLSEIIIQPINTSRGPASEN